MHTRNASFPETSGGGDTHQVFPAQFRRPGQLDAFREALEELTWNHKPDADLLVRSVSGS